MAPFIGQDDETLHFQDDAGGVIKIAKAGLPPDALAQYAPQVPAAMPTPAPNVSPEPTQVAAMVPPQVPNAPVPAPESLPEPSQQVPSDWSGSGGNAATQSSAAPDGLKPAGGRIDVSRLATKPAPAASPVQGHVDAFAKSFTAQGDAIRRAGQAGAEAASAESAYRKQFADDQQRQAIENQRREQERQKVLQEQVSKYEQMATELRSSKIDPNNYWAERGTGDKIAAGIGIMLGALSQGMTGAKENPVLKLIQTAIDKDLEIQKSNLAQKNSSLSAQENLLSVTRARFGDERAAESAARAAAYDLAKARVEQIAAKSQSPIMRANADKLIAQLDQEKSKHMVEFSQKAAQQAALAQLSTGGPVDVSALKDEDRERFVEGEGGIRGLAHTKEGAAKVRESLGTVKSATDSIDKLLDLGKKEGTQWLPTQVAAQAETLRNVLKGALRTELIGPGAVSESEWELLDTLIADPTAIKQLDANSRVRLETLKQTMRDSLAAKAEAQGVRVFKPKTFQARN